ncbi:uncharacterized protein C11orf87 homolog [Syngnathoides biaculeatus]|uniref:uncharacterized protein C11orf87 homolog n=1 Tax=Syngnathoides biaculeatus TaxID=300417 RepID=UPI002ADD5223|nr:uncharacterized protein C11orf87 homolog [Syngnathoides biaculeatus]
MTPPSSALSPAPRCLPGLGVNGTCAEQLSVAFPPLSSTLALLVLVAVLAGVVLVSVATFHFHKRRLKKRKIQRAQEEYERDSRRAATAAAAGGSARPCVIARPVRCGAHRVEVVTEEDHAGDPVEQGVTPADC